MFHWNSDADWTVNMTLSSHEQRFVVSPHNAQCSLYTCKYYESFDDIYHVYKIISSFVFACVIVDLCLIDLRDC